MQDEPLFPPLSVSSLSCPLRSFLPESLSAMISAQFLLALTFVPFVFSQANNGTLGVEAIEAHFSNAGIVPSLLQSFDPSAVLTLSYDGVGNISPGQPLTQSRKSTWVAS